MGSWMELSGAMELFLYLTCEGGYMTECVCQNSQSGVKTHTARVNFTVCKWGLKRKTFR